MAPTVPGDPSWTDGTTVFIDENLAPRDRVTAVAVQASLLAAGSLSPEILGDLARGRSTAHRYLAIEGHRALAAHEDVLPPFVRSRHRSRPGGASSNPATSLALAQGREPIVEPPAVFGVIRPKPLRTGRGSGSR